MSVEGRARAAAEERQRIRSLQRLEPSRLQTTVARDLAATLKFDVSTFDVAELGYRHPYYHVEIEHAEYLIRASYLWGGRDHGYSHAGSWKVGIRRRFWFGYRWVECFTLADLAELGRSAT